MNCRRCQDSGVTRTPWPPGSDGPVVERPCFLCRRPDWLVWDKERRGTPKPPPPESTWDDRADLQ